MFDISGDPKFWADAALGVCGFLSGAGAWWSTRKGAADKEAQPINPAQPSGHSSNGVTFLVDADLVHDLLAEVRSQHEDMRRWREEDDDRRQEEEREGLIAQVQDLKRQNNELKRGQGTTHGNQNTIVRRLDELMRRLDQVERRPLGGDPPNAGDESE